MMKKIKNILDYDLISLQNKFTALCDQVAYGNFK